MGHAILLEENEGVSDFIEAVREDVKNHAKAATAKDASKEVKKNVERAAAENGDFVKYAESAPNLSQWNCWVGEDGKLRMQPRLS
jgi:cell division septum initiation protein DivIVA